jgi:polyferredoxin
MDVRRWVQIAATAFTNAWWLFPFGGPVIYGGKLKSVCAPGLNCYSCPAAAAACPIGSLQFALASIKPSLEVGKFHFGLYMLGFLGTLGALVGRMPCAWLCPFGFFQELMHKIPSPKLAIWRGLYPMKYVFLAVFVILLPALVLDPFGYGQTWYCKYVCPAGTLEAGIPLLLMKPNLQDMIGPLFYNKFAILLLFLVWMVLSRRPFCRVACPLGAIYSLFNKVSVFRLTRDEEKCVRCKACERDCPMGVAFYEEPNHSNCIRCLKCLRHSCRYGAIGFEIAGSPPPLPDKPRPAETP